jgi:hypothetical protein
MTGEKRCRKCNDWKPVEDFTERRDKPGTYSPRCRACDGEKTRTQANRWQTTQRDAAVKASKVMERKPINPVSDHRREVNAERHKRMVERFGQPRTWRCQFFDFAPSDQGLPKCFGEIHGHEVVSRSKAGRTDENLLNMDGILTMCNFHNSWIEDHPADSKAWGLKK